MKLLLAISCLTCVQNNLVLSSQKGVFDKIFDGYEKALRPVRDDNTQVVVGIQPQIISLLEVNAEQEYIRIALYIDQVWKDEFLMWNPSEFNGTEVIKVPASYVWQPDITVESTSLEPEYFMSSEDRIVTIDYLGIVSLSYPFVLTNYCKMKIDEYPFDTQECIIKVSSWAHTKREIDIIHTNVSSPDTSRLRNNNTVWDVWPYVNESYDLSFGGNDPFVQIWYRLTIKRKPEYYVWVLIAPTLVITVLSLAGLYSPFSNSGDREEKVSLGLTTLLTLAVILTMVTDEMPRGSTLPLLGRFVLIEIVVIVISMAISVGLMFVHQRVTTRSWPVPNWMNWICHPSRRGEAADEQQVILGKIRRDSWQLDVPLYENTQPVSHQVILLRACVRQLNETHAKLSGWMDANEKEEMQKHHWLQVFDRFELSLLVIFQSIHLIGFILIFYPYFGTLH